MRGQRTSTKRGLKKKLKEKWKCNQLREKRRQTEQIQTQRINTRKRNPCMNKEINRNKHKTKQQRTK